MVKVHEGAEYVDIEYLTERLMKELEGVSVDDFIKARGNDPSIAPVEIEGKQYWPKIQIDVRFRIVSKDLPDAIASQS